MSELIVGRQPVLEALKSARQLEKVMLVFGVHGAAIQRIRQLAREQGIAVSEIDKKRFGELCHDVAAQGVAAVVATREYVDIDEILSVARRKGEPPFVVILDEIEDPHNLGALIRTAECAGAHGVVIPKHHSATITQTVVKTSAGASLLIPIAKVTNLTRTLEELKGQGLWIVGADMRGERMYDDFDYSGALALVVGSEGKGIRRLVKEKCDFVVKIPLFGKIESLNASVAGAIMMYEVARTRHKRKHAG